MWWYIHILHAFIYYMHSYITCIEFMFCWVSFSSRFFRKLWRNASSLVISSWLCGIGHSDEAVNQLTVWYWSQWWGSTDVWILFQRNHSDSVILPEPPRRQYPVQVNIMNEIIVVYHWNIVVTSFLHNANLSRDLFHFPFRAKAHIENAYIEALIQ